MDHNPIRGAGTSHHSITTTMYCASLSSSSSSCSSSASSSSSSSSSSWTCRPSFVNHPSPVPTSSPTDHQSMQSFYPLGLSNNTHSDESSIIPPPTTNSYYSVSLLPLPEFPLSPVTTQECSSADMHKQLTQQQCSDSSGALGLEVKSGEEGRNEQIRSGIWTARRGVRKSVRFVESGCAKRLCKEIYNKVLSYSPTMLCCYECWNYRSMRLQHGVTNTHITNSTTHSSHHLLQHTYSRRVFTCLVILACLACCIQLVLILSLHPSSSSSLYLVTNYSNSTLINSKHISFSHGDAVRSSSVNDHRNLPTQSPPPADAANPSSAVYYSFFTHLSHLYNFLRPPLHDPVPLSSLAVHGHSRDHNVQNSTTEIQTPTDYTPTQSSSSSISSSSSFPVMTCLTANNIRLYSPQHDLPPTSSLKASPPTTNYTKQSRSVKGDKQSSSSASSNIGYLPSDYQHAYITTGADPQQYPAVLALIDSIYKHVHPSNLHRLHVYVFVLREHLECLYSSINVCRQYPLEFDLRIVAVGDDIIRLAASRGSYGTKRGETYSTRGGGRVYKNKERDEGGRGEQREKIILADSRKGGRDDERGGGRGGNEESVMLDKGSRMLNASRTSGVGRSYRSLSFINSKQTTNSNTSSLLSPLIIPPPPRPSPQILFNFLRLYLPQLLPAECKAAVWIDADTILLRDITQLHDQATESFFPPAGAATRKEYGIAAVKRTGGYTFKQKLSAENLLYVETALNVKSTKSMFNAGVVVVNINYWRREKLTDEAEMIVSTLRRGGVATHKGQSTVESSQIPLNILFNHRPVLSLNAKWNRPHFGWNRHISPKAVSSAYLLHWNGPLKPWLPNGLYKHLWMPYHHSACCPLPQPADDAAALDVPDDSSSSSGSRDMCVSVSEGAEWYKSNPNLFEYVTPEREGSRKVIEEQGGESVRRREVGRKREEEEEEERKEKRDEEREDGDKRKEGIVGSCCC
eukprot:GHVQ01022007.1.p1 GENE.GHVQ01022007.1~~GHVQ01022007.1.p1  ORF type:complete len:972 (+),score=251.98 GHVQ01022007.1:42-2957(+)